MAFIGLFVDIQSPIYQVNQSCSGEKALICSNEADNGLQVAELKSGLESALNSKAELQAELGTELKTALSSQERFELQQLQPAIEKLQVRFLGGKVSFSLVQRHIATWQVCGPDLQAHQ